MREKDGNRTGDTMAQRTMGFPYSPCGNDSIESVEGIFQMVNLFGMGIVPID